MIRWTLKYRTEDKQTQMQTYTSKQKQKEKKNYIVESQFKRYTCEHECMFKLQMHFLFMLLTMHVRSVWKWIWFNMDIVVRFLPIYIFRECTRKLHISIFFFLKVHVVSVFFVIDAFAAFRPFIQDHSVDTLLECNVTVTMPSFIQANGMHYSSLTARYVQYPWKFRWIS